MRICCDRFGKHHCQAVEDLDENDNDRWFDDKNGFRDGLLDSKMTVLTSPSSPSAFCKEIANAAPRTLLKSRCVAANANNLVSGADALKIKKSSRCLRNDSIGTFRRCERLVALIIIQTEKNLQFF